MNFKQLVVETIHKASELDVETIDKLIEIPPNSEMGDFAFPCFQLAKTFRKAPQAISEELAQKIETTDYIEKVQNAGPYLNFFVSKQVYYKVIIEEILNKKDQYGSSNVGEGKTITIDYSSPNIAKPFHVGHLCSTAIGNALYKLFGFLGYNTIGINHLGDWGTQFGKVIVGYKLWGDDAVIEQDPIRELLKIYVRFHDEAEVKPEMEDEARSWFKKLEENDAEATALWQKFRDWSLQGLSKIYNMLDITFDSYNGEAFYNDKMDAVIHNLKEKNLLVESEGAMVVNLEDQNMPPCLIQKTDGATLYATRDLAAACYRHNEYNFYKNIYVVGTPQALHFRQVFEVLNKMDYDWYKECVHVGFGLVKFGDKKLSTRKGDVIFLEQVLEEAVKKTKEIIEEKNPELENKDEVAKQVGIGAIKFNHLKMNRERDITFTWEEALDFEGETGPYVQYAHARANSILKKAAFDAQNASIDYNLFTAKEEQALIKLLGDFKDVVLVAADKYEPSIITRHLLEIAKTFNKFYNACPILNSAENVKNARLLLVQAAAQTIKNGLYLIGLEAPKQM